jgi:rhodanese-related sulfurtransferase
MEPARWTVTDVAERIDHGEVPVFVDTRNPTAWSESDVKLPGAIRMPLDEIDSVADSIPRGRPVVTYCT